MNIYVASSWRNNEQPSVVETLRKDGHTVYDFKNPCEGDRGFQWRQLELGEKETWTKETYATKVLDHPVAKHGFDLDMNALDAASACVFVLPCGRSASLELGYAVGQGKLTIVYVPVLDEPELMYRMCDYVETSIDGVRRALSKWRPRPRWQRDLEAFDARGVHGGNQFEGTLPCNRLAHPDGRDWDGDLRTAREYRGPCREYHHRECKTCGGCWRHGACECSPDIAEFAR